MLPGNTKKSCWVRFQSGANFPRKILMSKYIHNTALHNLDAPTVLVPTVMEFVEPKSVLDVGCGIGTFLRVFKEQGVSRVLGIDGPWGKPELRVPHLSEGEFLERDLENFIQLNERFDLAVCLEVAEHLKPEAAHELVRTLVSASDVVWFSAAIPLQGGQNHLNEQPLSYWVNVFKTYDYELADVLRPIWWNQESVFVWYRQNSVFFHKKGYQFKIEPVHSQLVDVVHPELFVGNLTRRFNLKQRVRKLLYRCKVALYRTGRWM
jgi:SAM-dependent methyltransferase